MHAGLSADSSLRAGSGHDEPGRICVSLSHMNWFNLLQILFILVTCLIPYLKILIHFDSLVVNSYLLIRLITVIGVPTPTALMDICICWSISYSSLLPDDVRG